MANRRSYKPSKAMLRFIATLTDNARQYRWRIYAGASIRGYAPEIRYGKCTTPGEKAFCPITACYPTGLMSDAGELAPHFGLTKREGRDIMNAADYDIERFSPRDRRYYVVKALRPLLLKAVGLPTEEPTP